MSIAVCIGVIELMFYCTTLFYKNKLKLEKGFVYVLTTHVYMFYTHSGVACNHNMIEIKTEIIKMGL